MDERKQVEIVWKAKKLGKIKGEDLEQRGAGGSEWRQAKEMAFYRKEWRKLIKDQRMSIDVYRCLSDR